MKYIFKKKFLYFKYINSFYFILFKILVMLYLFWLEYYQLFFFVVIKLMHNFIYKFKIFDACVFYRYKRR